LKSQSRFAEFAAVFHATTETEDRRPHFSADPRQFVARTLATHDVHTSSLIGLLLRWCPEDRCTAKAAEAIPLFEVPAATPAAAGQTARSGGNCQAFAAGLPEQKAELTPNAAACAATVPDYCHCSGNCGSTFCKHATAEPRCQRPPLDGLKWCFLCKCEFAACDGPRSKIKGYGRWCQSCARKDPQLGKEPAGQHYTPLASTAVKIPSDWTDELALTCRWASALDLMPRTDFATFLRWAGKWIPFTPGGLLAPEGIIGAFLCHMMSGKPAMDKFGALIADSSALASPPLLREALVAVTLWFAADETPRPNLKAHQFAAPSHLGMFLGVRNMAHQLGIIEDMESPLRPAPNRTVLLRYNGKRVLFALAGTFEAVEGALCSMLQAAQRSALRWPTNAAEFVAFAEGAMRLTKEIRRVGRLPGGSSSQSAEALLEKYFLRGLLSLAEKQAPEALDEITFSQLGNWLPDAKKYLLAIQDARVADTRRFFRLCKRSPSACGLAWPPSSGGKGCSPKR